MFSLGHVQPWVCSALGVFSIWVCQHWVCSALGMFSIGCASYTQVISLLLPLKYDFIRMGGSLTQRQVFNHTLIHAAIRANQLPMALALVAELQVRVHTMIWWGVGCRSPELNVMLVCVPVGAEAKKCCTGQAI